MDPLESVFYSLPDKIKSSQSVWMLVTPEEKRHIENRRNEREKKKHPPKLSPKWKAKKAKSMRRHPTEGERVLRDAMIARAVPFETQRVILGYIVDFYFPSHKLVVEVDGSIHDGRKEEDAFRDHVFRSNGFFVLRFSNETIISDAQSVIADILKECSRIPTMNNKEALKIGRVAFIEKQDMKPRKGKYKWDESAR